MAQMMWAGCALAGLMVGGLSSRALAQGQGPGQNIPCGAVETGSIHIDGMVSDWQGVDSVELSDLPMPGLAPALGAGRPLKARVHCNYDKDAVYLLINVEDDILARTREAQIGEDHLELAFAVPAGAKTGGPGATVDRLLYWPSSWSQKLPRHARWSSGRPLRLIDGEGPAGRTKPLSGPPAFEAWDALQPKGYAIELRLPKRLLPGYHEGAPLPLSVRVVDGDSRAQPRAVAIAQTSPQEHPEELSRVVFAEGESNLTALLENLKLQQDDIFFDQNGDLGGGGGRILLLGRFLATVGKEYAYQEVSSGRASVKDAQLVDVEGGRKALALRVIEHGGNGSREVLRLYQVRGGLFQVIFAAEVGKQQGKNLLSTAVSYVKRGKQTDVVLTAQPALGFSADSYGETPAEDVLPILLPWRDKRARYVLKNGAYVKAE